MILLFSILTLFLAMGLPIAFALGLSAMIPMVLQDYPLSTIALTMTDGLNSFALVALPLFILSGALMSYAVSLVQSYRRAASYVDKILRGANPAVLARADRVIE